MTNSEKLNKAFCDAFEVESNVVEELKYKESEMWDSVGHMTLIANVEDVFDIMILPEDLMNFSSYTAGKDILTNKYDIEF